MHSWVVSRIPDPLELRCRPKSTFVTRAARLDARSFTQPSVAKMTSSPFFDNICTLPLPSDIFAAALHPTQPLLTVGLASGHVRAYRLPSDDETSSPPAEPHRKSVNGTNGILSRRRRSSTASENGLGAIDTIWKTRRHKGSCRALAYSPDGSVCFSGGTDGLVKAFDAETGKVVSKVDLSVPKDWDGEEPDAPTLLHVLTPLHLVAATDSGAVYIFELKDKSRIISQKPTQVLHPHGDQHVNSLVPIPPTAQSTSGYPKQFVTVGGSTLAMIDLRKGVVATSEDQEIEVSSVALLEGLKSGRTSVGAKVLVGQSDGILSLFEKGVWGDIDERIYVDGEGASVDALCEVPFEFLPKAGKLKMNEKIVACGLDDGTIRFVRIGRNAVLHEWELKHDDLEGVTSISFDADGQRMITGGGQTVKVWTRASTAAEAVLNVNGKRALVNDSDQEEEELEERSEDEDGAEDGSEHDVEEASNSEQESEDENVGKRKKRKRNKGKDKSGGRVLSLSGMF